MWQSVSSIILRNRILLLIIVGVLAIFMGYKAFDAEMSYDYAPLLPEKDSAFADYQKFLSEFGEEGNIIVIGITDDQFFQKDHFERWKKLSEDLRSLDHIEDMISVPNSYQMVKNKDERKFEFERIFPDEIDSQEELDSLHMVFKTIPLYRNYLYNDTSNTYLLVLTANSATLKSRERDVLVMNLKKRCKVFEEEAGIKLHYSGLPYIRVTSVMMIKDEIYIFTVLALVVCLIILFIFFRSFKAMFFPAVVVLIGVVFVMGTLGIFHYKITLLTGMIPPLLIVIGIPNSIFMLNKYHQEYSKHGNKIKALKRVIMKIGNAIFLTNLTTACGFATFTITSSKIIREFGIVASINIMALFVLSILLIPIIFSFVPAPKERHVKHLENQAIGKITDSLVSITLKYRKAVYVIAVFVVGGSIYGMTLMHQTGYMVDDIPESNPIYTDLKYFEEQFTGLMPLEIMVDTKKKNGVFQLSTLKKFEQLEKKLSEYDDISTSVSILNIIKMAKQAFYNGKEKYYSLPNNSEKNFILSYASKGDQGINLLSSFIDSTRSIARLSIRVKDVGNERMSVLYDSFRRDVSEIFPTDKYDVTVTGSTIVSFKGNQYLNGNLFASLALAIGLIAVFMAIMFNSPRMVLMSLIPNVIPLLFTAALMGYSGIPIKASTILVFSIAFGISVDNTIHFLAKYRQELTATNWNIRKSVVKALKETGVSMVYTSTVLFFGFMIFAFSGFGGTQAMGILVSITLLVALMSNLILLPSLLIGFEKRITNQSFKEPLLQIYNEEEDIELDDLEIEPIKKIS